MATTTLPIHSAAMTLRDHAYTRYLDEVIFSLGPVQHTRASAAHDIGPSIVAVTRLSNTLRKLGVTDPAGLFRLGLGDLAATPGVGLRQLEIACVVLDAAGHDVDKFIGNWRGRTRKAAIGHAQKRGTKRKAGKRTYRKG